MYDHEKESRKNKLELRRQGGRTILKKEQELGTGDSIEVLPYDVVLVLTTLSLSFLIFKTGLVLPSSQSFKDDEWDVYYLSLSRPWTKRGGGSVIYIYNSVKITKNAAYSSPQPLFPIYHLSDLNIKSSIIHIFCVVEVEEEGVMYPVTHDVPWVKGADLKY